MGKFLVYAVLLAVLVAGGYFLVTRGGDSLPGYMTGEDDMMMNDGDAIAPGKEPGGRMPAQQSQNDITTQAGSYEPFAPEKISRAAHGKVVLFFRASWCPTCRGLDANIRANISSIPSGVAILDVDYDKAISLRQTYGVTYQHTLVQVNADGKQISKWSNSPTLAELITHIL
jgi:thiol-disulfide isomerase/thioredoxin